MKTLVVDFGKTDGKILPENAVNNGPCGVGSSSQNRANYDEYKNARFPYARNHDASFNSGYGGEHSNDISGIFPDFNADPYDENSYDFVLTDKYVKDVTSTGTKFFFRLGQKIEHSIKKYHINPPEDFKKWAVICEHIIRHYTMGWANGFNYDIEYWEIWNEPDCGLKKKTCWTGTDEQFFELFEITAKHLKKCFPNLKIGGPAVESPAREWTPKFLDYCKNHNVPMDFYSWHRYDKTPDNIYKFGVYTRELLDSYGYNKTESILDEWNYVHDWHEGFVDAVLTIISLKGSSYALASMIGGQNAKIDMMMYYDARPCAFNGLFDYYTLKPIYGYYVFNSFADIKELENNVPCSADGEIFAIASEKEDKKRLLFTYYNDEPENETEKVKITLKNLKGNKKIKFFVLDNEKKMEEFKTFEIKENAFETEFDVKMYSSIFAEIE